MKSKVILIMIDGVSSEYFLNYPQYLPNLHALAKNNTVMTELNPACCASSLPGRTLILTGQPSCDHGIYGNSIWDSDLRRFRYASPYDIRVPSILELAKKAGLDTASIGFGMSKPEDCNLFEPVYWIDDFICRSRDNEPIAVSDDWTKASKLVDDGRLERVKQEIDQTADGPCDATHPFLSEMKKELRMIQLVNGILNSQHPPDVIFTEINSTDTIQHQCGYASNTAHFSMAFADMLVGTIIQNLTNNNRLDDYTIMITSDHGHGKTEQAIFADKIVVNDQWSAESAVLFIEQSGGLDTYADQFSPLGVEALDNHFLPLDVRDQLAVYSSRQNVSFETSDPSNNGLVGESNYLSSHSYYPGCASDNRFAVISGSTIQKQHICNAQAQQFHAYLLDLLELD